MDLPTPRISANSLTPKNALDCVDIAWTWATVALRVPSFRGKWRLIAESFEHWYSMAHQVHEEGAGSMPRDLSTKMLLIALANTLTLAWVVPAAAAGGSAPRKPFGTTCPPYGCGTFTNTQWSTVYPGYQTINSTFDGTLAEATYSFPWSLTVYVKSTSSIELDNSSVGPSSISEGYDGWWGPTYCFSSDGRQTYQIIYTLCYPATTELSTAPGYTLTNLSSSNQATVRQFLYVGGGCDGSDQPTGSTETAQNNWILEPQ